MYSMWLTEAQQRLWRDYLAMTGRLQMAMHRQLQQACGMTLADYDVLVTLSERGRLRIGELGEALGWEQSRLSHQLRRMRERGLVLRSGNPDDGRAQLRRAAPGHAELIRAVVFDGMTPAEARTLREWTATVLGRLG